MKKEVSIKRKGEHYVVYVNGEFFCTADTYKEAVKEVEDAGYKV